MLRERLHSFRDSPPPAFLETIGEISRESVRIIELVKADKRAVPSHAHLRGLQDTAASIFADACGVKHSRKPFYIHEQSRGAEWRYPLRLSHGYSPLFPGIRGHASYFRARDRHPRPVMLVGMPYTDCADEIRDMRPLGLAVEELPSEWSWWYPAWTRFHCIVDIEAAEAAG